MENWIVPRRHGNKKRRPPDAYSFEVKKYVFLYTVIKLLECIVFFKLSIDSG